MNKEINKEVEKEVEKEDSPNGLIDTMRIHVTSLRESIQESIESKKRNKNIHVEHAENKEHVVVVHGLYLNGTWTKVLSQRLKNAGFSTSEFSYRTVISDLDENAQKLHDHFQAIEADVVHGVGHSLGGVLLQHMFDKYDVTKTGRVVALGSPFMGSSVANYLSKNPMASALLGKSIGDVLDSDDRHWNTHHDLGIIAGTVAVGLGSVFPKMLDGPNDGTVLVSETKLPGFKEHITVPVSHTALIFSPRTSGKVISFLQKGSFEA